MVRKPLLIALAIALLLPAGIGIRALWLNHRHAEEAKAYREAEVALADLALPSTLGHLARGGNCTPAADRRCLVSDLWPNQLTHPLLSLMGGAHAQVWSGSECNDWQPGAQRLETFAQRLASIPCTIGGTIGGHPAVAITWAHMLPLGARPIPQDAIRFGSSRFNHYYFGTDITIELVHGPSTS